MRIVLLRHGQTDWNAAGRLQGQQDIPINVNGRRQIEAVCRTWNLQFRSQNPLVPMALVSSPLQRAYESARICGTWFNLPVTVMAEFAERGFGHLEGMTKQDLLRCYGVADAEQIESSQFGVESVDALRERLMKGMTQLHQAQAGQTVLLVTHGSIIRRLLLEYGNAVSRQTYRPLMSDSVDVVHNGTFAVLDWVDGDMPDSNL
ncbi:histidine phosphatase family protein [Alicyclobacillaceae bacterium I2511]|jgi:broad specificity phosphatase PhoE|nr:histidine phosphatase family protein [Alicyclobacillaceae bacterium I2511]